MSKQHQEPLGRRELQLLRERSIHMEEVTPNQNWKAAYAALALAADHLDAMIARSEVHTVHHCGNEHPDRVLRLITAVKGSHCYHSCPAKGEHGALCQQIQEVEKLLESQKQ